MIIYNTLAVNFTVEKVLKCDICNASKILWGLHFEALSLEKSRTCSLMAWHVQGVYFGGYPSVEVVPFDFYDEIAATTAGTMASLLHGVTPRKLVPYARKKRSERSINRTKVGMEAHFEQVVPFCHFMASVPSL